jgi:hypothetical protein
LERVLAKNRSKVVTFTPDPVLMIAKDHDVGLGLKGAKVFSSFLIVRTHMVGMA